MATPLGLHAPRLDAVRALLTKRGRREQGRYAVEGPTMLADAFASGLEPFEVYATESAASEHRRLLERFEERSYVVPERAMARLSDLEAPPGILATFPTELTDIAALLAHGAPVAVLAGVSDPGNAGTLLRTAEIFGITAAAFVGDTVEPHNPKVVRGTMGALYRMRLAVCNAAELVEAARTAEYTIVGTAREGRPLPGYRFPARSMIAIGNERHGVAHVLPHCDEDVSIPHFGRGESLNASIAGGIIFYAFSQQSERTIFESQTFKKP